MRKRSAYGWSVVTLVAALVTLPALTATAGTAAAPTASVPTVDYPSWDEVNAAKNNEAAKQAEVDNIRGLLSDLQTRAAELENIAFDRGQEYQEASYAAQVAAEYAGTLQTQADAATERATAANTQVGLLAAQLYRSGGDHTMNLLLDQDDSDSLLYRLGAMSKLTEQTAGVRNAAVAAQNTADALTEQATKATTERQRLEQEAADRKAEAEDLQADAVEQVIETQSRTAELTAQLASLDAAAAEVEAQYQKGKEEEDRRRAAEAATEAPGSTWVPGGDEIMSPDESKAYAESIMPEYGWGNDQYQCLVRLWIGESGWRANAYNESSGAYGIPQSLPASKMASAGADYVTNAMTQIRWGLTYIEGRYDTPCGALSFWNNQSPHWY
ncbi:coiled-coil domain-containing protein [Herbiconiux liukaitaii]|uniref:coiled-coil domain-containing protein n=1 Tax=Herbiconiux liukaitaii TaxID=3342799 RepID=UPI0035B8388B